MTVGATARRLIVAAGIGLGLAGSTVGAQPMPGPDACRTWPASFLPIDPEERRPRASRPDEIVVPVAIHFMNADVPAPVRAAATYDEGDKIASPGKRVHDIWTKQSVRRFFKYDGLVNEILAGLDVRVALVHVEECRYDPGRLRGDGQQVDWIYTPLANRAGARRLFQTVNERYRLTETRAVDVFVWWSVVDGRPNLRGYGGSVARGGPAVWVDRICALTDPKTQLFDTPARCAHLLAHEIGHALTLRHVCRATTSARDPDADLKVGVCGADDTKWLMHPLYKGKRVSYDEKGQVREFAVPYFVQP
ncbi:MAG TPA: hypothetical protein VID28_17920 [Methylomirabilota bacterium]